MCACGSLVMGQMASRIAAIVAELEEAKTRSFLVPSLPEMTRPQYSPSLNRNSHSSTKRVDNRRSPYETTPYLFSVCRFCGGSVFFLFSHTAVRRIRGDRV